MSKNPCLKNFHSGLDFTAYRFFGCHKTLNGDYVFRVWAPHAKEVYIKGNFGGSAKTHRMERIDDNESFEVTVKASVGDTYIYEIVTCDNRRLLKADPYAFKSDFPNSFNSVVYDLPEPTDYPELYKPFDYAQPINIYEVNLLSWKRHKDNGYLSYKELEKELVPYVKQMGYTHVEFMPVTEFPFDGSWGYQVTGYFAPTSRLGTPHEFQSLINAFHANGIKVIIDWVPAHFPKDDFGLYEFDGQPLYECPLWDRMEHKGWGTRRFDFGRGEIDSFLLSSAHCFFDIYRIDGLRVDAVASMLYLDYDRKAGEFTPNIHGDNRNLEAIGFLRKFNSLIKREFPGAITIAEESTSFDGITRKVQDGGLGFDFKWNMGWMNDTLFYCRQDPYFRNHHHDKLTFSLMYAFSERFILPLSHDEVVHVKGSILNKMPGEYADKFTGERELLGFMFAHPGKKLNFMGYEVAQFKEWDYREGIEFFLKKFEKHSKMSDFVRELNIFYKTCKPLYEADESWNGFEWLVVDDRYNNLLAFNRYSKDGESLTAIINFSGVDLQGYGIGIEKGKYRLIFNTDCKKFGGEGKLKKKVFKTVKQSSHGKDYTLIVDIPRLTCIYLKKEK
ncbi:MAG: 1,4-alpha-glucan branching protein GlgB [Clostridiales bacterium]|nr:1,4-alpha-glucan branching protein GlgB [Clostridiales bacterium]